MDIVTLLKNKLEELKKDTLSQMAGRDMLSDDGTVWLDTEPESSEDHALYDDGYYAGYRAAVNDAENA